MTKNDIDKINRLSDNLKLLDVIIMRIERHKHTRFSVFMSKPMKLTFMTILFDKSRFDERTYDLPSSLNDKIINLIYEERDNIQKQLDEIECSIKGE